MFHGERRSHRSDQDQGDQGGTHRDSAPTVLLAIRDSGTRALTSFMLRTVGYEAVEVTSVRSAVEAVGATRPEVIVIDQDLDRTDCLAVCGQMQRFHLSRPTPIILLADHMAEIDRALARRSGVVDFMGKPVRMAVLVEGVKLLIPNQAAKQSTIAQRLWNHTARDHAGWSRAAL